MLIRGYSVGGASSWVNLQELDILFDAGDGVTAFLGTDIRQIKHVFISHFHSDHISGLIQLLILRKSLGSGCEPLRVHIPFWCGNTKFFNEQLYPFNDDKNIIIELVNFRSSIQITNKTRVDTFKLHHGPKCTAMGYRVLEARKRLRPEFTPEQVPALIKAGVKDLDEAYEAITFAYTLDSSSFDPLFIRDAEVWFADCTFLNASDRGENTHMTLPDVYRYANQVNVKKTILAHISPRYQGLNQWQKYVSPQSIDIGTILPVMGRFNFSTNWDSRAQFIRITGLNSRGFIV